MDERDVTSTTELHPPGVYLLSGTACMRNGVVVPFFLCFPEEVTNFESEESHGLEPLM